jgi:hypothetical protein
MPSLLEQAKSFDRKRKNHLEEEMELFLAWCRDEVKLDQIRKALNHKNGANAYRFLAFCARQYIGRK